MAKLALFWRIFFGGAGLFLTFVMGAALIVAINSSDLHSLSVASTIETVATSANLFIAGIVLLIIAIRGKARTRRLELVGWVLAVATLFSLLLPYILMR